MRNTFLEKSCAKCGETSLRPFSKKSKVSIFLDQQAEIFYSLFLFYILVKDYQNISKLSCWRTAFTAYKTFILTEFWY